MRFSFLARRFHAGVGGDQEVFHDDLRVVVVFLLLLLLFCSKLATYITTSDMLGSLFGPEQQRPARQGKARQASKHRIKSSPLT